MFVHRGLNNTLHDRAPLIMPRTYCSHFILIPRFSGETKEPYASNENLTVEDQLFSPGNEILTLHSGQCLSPILGFRP